MDDERRTKLAKAIAGLTDKQLSWIEAAVARLTTTGVYHREPTSDLVSECVLHDFGDTLRHHHGSSTHSLSKDQFEHAFERALKNCGVDAALAPRGNPGHDITVAGQRISLKTQANTGIRDDQVWISKFMEMGKGAWATAADVPGLLQRFFNHMDGYDRIVMLRALQKSGTSSRYELIEIPKSLLLEAAGGTIEMPRTRQTGAPPAYCQVRDARGNLKFQLYFDGGSERKLQLKALDRRLCTTHATWTFDA